jgi:hypothetical protein
VVVSAHTYKLTEGHFQFKPLGTAKAAQPVAQVLGDVPRVALDRLRRRLLIDTHDAAQVLGVEALGEIG